MSSKTTVSPRSSSAYATQEMEIMAAFLCKNKVECNPPADFHADVSNHKSPSSVTAFDKRYGSPRSPGYIFSISTMEKNEELYGPDLVEFGSSTNEGRAGLIRTASLKEWMGALSRENLVETAIEKLKRQESDGHGRNWFEFRDREEAICCSEVFTPAFYTPDETTRFVIEISDTESEGSFISACSSQEELTHRKPYGVRMKEAKEPGLDATSFANAMRLSFTAQPIPITNIESSEPTQGNSDADMVEIVLDAASHGNLAPPQAIAGEYSPATDEPVTA